MGCDRDVNAYYWPEYKKVESGAWKFENYDTNGESTPDQKNTVLLHIFAPDQELSYYCRLVLISGTNSLSLDREANTAAGVDAVRWVLPH
jgi:hypothetical protein